MVVVPPWLVVYDIDMTEAAIDRKEKKLQMRMREGAQEELE